MPAENAALRTILVSFYIVFRYCGNGFSQTRSAGILVNRKTLFGLRRIWSWDVSLNCYGVSLKRFNETESQSAPDLELVREEKHRRKDSAKSTISVVRLHPVTRNLNDLRRYLLTCTPA